MSVSWRWAWPRWGRRPMSPPRAGRNAEGTSACTPGPGNAGGGEGGDRRSSRAARPGAPDQPAGPDSAIAGTIAPPSFSHASSAGVRSGGSAASARLSSSLDGRSEARSSIRSRVPGTVGSRPRHNRASDRYRRRGLRGALSACTEATIKVVIEYDCSEAATRALDRAARLAGDEAVSVASPR